MEIYARLIILDFFTSGGLNSSLKFRLLFKDTYSLNVKNVCNLIFETRFSYSFLGCAMNKVWEAKPQNISLLKNVMDSFFSLWSQILQSLHSKYFFPNWTTDGAIFDLTKTG